VGYYRGCIKKVFFGGDSPYHAFSFKVLEAKGEERRPRNVKVSGYFFGIEKLIEGAVLEISGEWEIHQKYGLQYKASGWQPWARDENEVRFFLGNCVKVFDNWKVLSKTVQVFGTETYDALLNGHDLSADEEEEEVLRLACTRWRRIRGEATLAEFLRKHGLSATMVAQIFMKFGEDSIDIIRDDPYRLMEIEGFPFRQVDTLAMKRGFQLGDPRRIKGGVLWTLREQTYQGHLFARRGDIAELMNVVAASNGVAPFDATDLPREVTKAIEELERDEKVKVDPGVGVYLPDMYLYEREGASLLTQFLSPSELVIDVGIFLRNYESVNSITLSDRQREAIERLIANRVLVVTGAPGTGKTTLIRAFVHLFRQLGVSYNLMAPTGIAAKRLAAVTEDSASTIHRALKYDGFQWWHNRHEPLRTQAIIVDECSMVDQGLFYRLLDALESETMIVLVGDDAQLPSVGPGNVLRELLLCEAVSHVRLEHVFRQAETSDIVKAAHRIRAGKTPLDLPVKEQTEFQFREISEERQIAGLIVKMAAKLKGRDANFQVLSPKYEGVVGVNNLNNLLRDELNPDKGQARWSLPEFQTRVGDRLMVIKNNYELNVYNGDIGKLVAIKKDSLTLRIHGVGNTPDTNVEVPKDEARLMLKLAYAVTVHRCQGEEFETIILPLVRRQGRMLQRNLFYTAITRARNKVWLLGQSDAVLKAVANDKVVQRNTIFRDLVGSENG